MSYKRDYVGRATAWISEEFFVKLRGSRDTNSARRLIELHGYWRRKEELEDAEAALGKA
jgi:hypothetical protein